MRTLVKAHKRITSAGGQVTNNTPQYFLRDVGGSCAEDVTAYNALTDSAKTALPTALPATTTSWIVRNCGGGAETQPAVVTTFPDQEFASAAVRTIVIPANYFSGGNLVFSATRGDMDPLRDGITFNPATRTYTLPSTLTDEYYILRTVATNSIGSIADAFAVRLAYNEGVVTDSVEAYAPNSGFHGDTGGTVEVVPPVAGDPSSYGITSTFIY